MEYTKAILFFAIKDDYAMLDCLLDVCFIKLRDASKTKASWNMNVNFLEETNIEMKQIWESLRSAKFFSFKKIKKMVSFHKTYCFKVVAKFKKTRAKSR